MVASNIVSGFYSSCTYLLPIIHSSIDADYHFILCMCVGRREGVGGGECIMKLLKERFWSSTWP